MLIHAQSQEKRKATQAKSPKSNQSCSRDDDDEEAAGKKRDAGKTTNNFFGEQQREKEGESLPERALREEASELVFAPRRRWSRAKGVKKRLRRRRRLPQSLSPRGRASENERHSVGEGERAGARVGKREGEGARAAIWRECEAFECFFSWPHSAFEFGILASLAATFCRCSPSQ